MRFRGAISFNAQDTGFHVGERITINPGVEYRCELVLARIMKHRKGVSVKVLVDEINTEQNCLYSQGDISYVLKRLYSEGYVQHMDKDSWKASARAQAAWDRAERITI